LTTFQIIKVALVATTMLETIFALITSVIVATCGLHIKCRHFTLSLGYLSIVGLDKVWDGHELGLGGDVVSVAGLD
jgi:hypothetical protein